MKGARWPSQRAPFISLDLQIRRRSLVRIFLLVLALALARAAGGRVEFHFECLTGDLFPGLLLIAGENLGCLGGGFLAQGLHLLLGFGVAEAAALTQLLR